jgi:AraC family transcriptional activator of tynA and feaB
MVSFSIWPESKSASRPLDDWRKDRDVVDSFGTCSRIWPNYARGARVFFKAAPVGEMLLCGTAASAPLVYDTIPLASRNASERAFYLMMPNMPRYVDNAGKRFVHQAGECMLADSSARSVAAYNHAHSGLCLSIPVDTVRRYIPEPERFVDIPFGREGLAKMLPRLLLSIWKAAETGDGCGDGRKAAETLLGVLARCCARMPAGTSRGDVSRKVRCEQIKDRINADLRNPKLSVRSVAQMVGVTTRYLQLLFAHEDDCVSQYIKRERLRGCLLDLRDTDFDDRSITEIAFSWGFNSAAHFSSSFRREYGLSPRDYRSADLDALATLRHTEVEGPLLQALQFVNRPG